MTEDKPTVKYLQVKPDEAGQRLDNYLIKYLKGLPKSNIYRILRKGEVRVNKRRAKPDYRINSGDEIRIPPLRLAETTETIAPSKHVLEALADNIVYEDKNIVVLNKPSGMPVHGGSGQSYGVIEAFRKLRPQVETLELVHRLDKETSGCLLLAKKRSVLKELHDLLRDGKMQKTYVALVKGRWPSKINAVDVPLLKNQMASGERIVKINPAGKAAKTLFKAISYYSNVTLVEASPITGRTHQIRVHAQYMGCPLVGDTKYGSNEFNQLMRRHGAKRLCLHASRLKFTLSSTEQVYEFFAPLPQDLEQVFTRLKQHA